jgi:SWI/SNF-related matrix-associated actin-dependent regulator 1 of chromatin subfamily A
MSQKEKSLELKYSPKGKVFYVRCGYDDREIPKEAGFMWDRWAKVWSTPSVAIAEKLKDNADEEAKKALIEVARQADLSNATDTEYFPPVPDGLEYFPFQRAGIEMAANMKRSLIADEMGLGKTIQAIGVMNVTLPKLSIVVCPASLKHNWLRELQTWFIAADKSCFRVMNGTIGHTEDHGVPWPEADHVVIIVNYDVVWKPKVHDTLKYGDFDLVVLDEAHYLKNHKTNRTKGVLGPHSFTRKAKQVVAMSGTPVLNRPIELYALIKNLAPHIIKPYADYYAFGKKFCGAYKDQWGWNDRGASNTKDLNARLRSGFMIRRMKKQVLKDLPPRQYQIIPLQPDKEMKKVIKQQAAALDIKSVAKQEIGEELGELAKERHELAQIKMPVCLTHIQDLLKDVDKLVVFAYHKDTIAEIKDAFKESGAVAIDGSTPVKERQKIVDKFQNDPDTKVFIGQIQAAGVGLTLTAASTVVFVEFSWVPGEIVQAVDRCHRIGQKDNVLAQFLVVEGSLEEHMMRSVLDKVKTINKVVG